MRLSCAECWVGEGKIRFRLLNPPKDRMQVQLYLARWLYHIMQRPQHLHKQLCFVPSSGYDIKEGSATAMPFHNPVQHGLGLGAGC